MTPSIYQFNHSDIGFEIYLGEFSTSEGLSVFDENTELEITCFGATLFKEYGWATENDIPSLRNVRSVKEFFISNGDIGLVEFEANLSGYGTFSTHDDGECHYVLKSQKQCISILKYVLPSQYSDKMINKLISNPGIYISCDKNGEIKMFHTFEDYLKNA